MAEVLRIRVRADTVWQDSAGTIPAGVGDPVGRVDDPDRGISVTQDVTGNKPTLLQDANGHLFLDGDGLDDYLSNATFQPTPGGAQPFTVIAVARGKGTATINPIWSSSSGTRDYRQRDSRDYQLNFGSPLRGGLPDTTLHIHHVEVNGASSAIYLDNTLVASGNGGSNQWTAGLLVLSTWDQTQFGNQELYELIIHDGLLDATARTALYDELWDYYSNPAGGGGGEVEVSGADAGVVASEPLLTPRYSVSPDGALVGVSAAEADAVPRYVVTPEGALVSVGASQPDLSFEEAGEARPESASVAVEASSPALTPRYAIFPESSRSTVSAPQASIGERVRRYMKRIRLGIGIGY